MNCTLKRSPEPSHTQGLIDRSRSIMERHGVAVEVLRAVDHDIATGTWPDMTEHGWPTDEWPAIYRRVLAADILVLCGPDLAGRQQLGHEAGDRAAVRLLEPAQRRPASTPTTAGSAGA